MVGIDKSSQTLLRAIIQRQIRDNEKNLKLWRKDREPYRLLRNDTNQLKNINNILMGKGNRWLRRDQVEENKFKHTLYFDQSQGDYVGSWFYSANEYKVSDQGLEKLHMCGHLGFPKEDFEEGIDYVKVKGNK